MSIFAACFAEVVGTEGGFTADPADPGNWTGDSVGVGECKGTNWGISAGAYPGLDIATLSQADAAAIYLRDYWAPIEGDSLAPPLALIVFDAAVNSGVDMAIRWLQMAVGVVADGALGPVTRAAIAAHAGEGAAVCAEILARRLVFMSGLPTWPTFGLGWARRIAHLSFAALNLPAV